MNNPDKLMPLKDHLEELRVRLLICLGSILLFSVWGFILWPKILEILKLENLTLVYISPQEAILVRFKVSLAFGFLCSIPLITLEAWKFFRPALHPRERDLTLWFIIISMTLFILGVIFNLYIVFPIMVNFLVMTAEAALTPMISVNSYTSLAFQMTIAFAAVSQIPVCMAMLAGAGFIDPHSLAAYRKSAIIGIFIIAALITPPDALSQIVLALPMCALFELGVILAKIVKASRQRRKTKG